MEATGLVWRAAFPQTTAAQWINGVPPAEVVYARTSIAVTILLSVWVVTYLVLKIAFFGAKEFKGAPLKSWALKTTVLVHHVVAACYASALIAQDPILIRILTFRGTADDAHALMEVGAASRVPEGVSLLVPWTVAYMVVDLILLPAWSVGSSRADNILMVFHHIFSMMSWAPGLHCDFGVRYILYFIATEITSVFMVLMWFLTQLGHKGSPLFLLNGLFFALSYLLVRVVPIPALAYMFYLYPPWARPLVDSGSFGLTAYQYFGCTMVPLPFLLNIFWAKKVLGGFYKQAVKSLGGGKKKR